MPEGEPNKLADEFTKSGLKLNQIVAQFMIGGEMFKTAGGIIKGTTGVKSLSPIEGIRARQELKKTKSNIKDIESGKLNVDLKKEAIELQKMLNSEQPKVKGETRLEKDAATPIDKGKGLSEGKKSILEHDLGLIEGLEKRIRERESEFFKPTTLERITAEIKNAA